ncbi:MAG: bifunctional 2-methylcitrate dehydratase/aconitate hydratase [Rhodospirillales bacterium]
MAASNNTRPEPDTILKQIAAYVYEYAGAGPRARDTAHLCFFDAVGCGFPAHDHPECAKLLGPPVEGMTVPFGARVPGTAFELDPVTAAFDISALNRWLDFNDSYFGKEGGHPSDNLGGLLAVTDHLSRKRRAAGAAPFTMKDVLSAMIKAHEIQGNLAQVNGCNQFGFDCDNHTKVATAAVTARLMGATYEQIINGVSNAFADGPSLRAYRHAPNVGWRKSWAAADASARGVHLAMMAVKNEMGYPGILSTKKHGYFDAYYHGEAFEFIRPLGSHVIENVLFKTWPAGFHAQSAMEAAVRLHPEASKRLDAIERIEIDAHRYCLNQISKEGPLHNPADRDHCLQYIVAVGLIFGDLESAHYEDAAAADPRIDPLRAKMIAREKPAYTEAFYNVNDPANPHAVQVFYKDGSKSEKSEVFYPLGHASRRAESKPLLAAKFRRNVAGRLSAENEARLLALFEDRAEFEAVAVDDFMALLAA